MEAISFVQVAESLDNAGLIWVPEIGDEVSNRRDLDRVSILVDPQGMSAEELRGHYLWLPTIEQLVYHIEARQGILFHTGLELSTNELSYKTVVQIKARQIESKGHSLRTSLGLALKNMLVISSSPHGVH